ncbi:hypothetical protein M4R22_02780 [Acidovorax sp. GBBC 3334]|uniref:hypothetical protein n=1 Tax=Acidovorax sp. GBBC 3334 TaxID=2940496 RepID=UPI002302125A|nr:hypothetical protein [Acidovorax sp. GBBC 3334]MDA8453681.1 hypothetical protein [Acidovorax sp. GBBC 3334]
MKSTTCLQYCVNGMSDRIFSFAKSKDGKALLHFYKKNFTSREVQIRELLIAYNSYFMVQAAIQLKGMPKTRMSVIKFMTSEGFTRLNDELVKTVEGNLKMLLSCLSSKQKRKLDELFQ